MKRDTRSILPRLLLGAIFFPLHQGCVKRSISNPTTRQVTYTIYTPTYQMKQAALDSINGDASKTIDSLGKIYIKDQFIYLNDVDKGIHVIDNTDPAHPVQTAFLRIPGNQDIAIQGNTLYADMYSDLLVVDISDIHRVRISTLMPALFTDREIVNGFFMDSSQVITSWAQRDTTVTVTQYSGPTLVYPAMSLGSATFSSNASSSNSSTTGVAGSSAKMVLINNFLYAITERHQLGAIDVSIPQSPNLVSNQFAGYDLETIFPFKDKLFLGSDIGTFIYDIIDPSSPTETGEFTHGKACDPVITDGTNAYITLHAGTICGGSSNELDVVNVQNLMDPTLVKTYPMTSPTGLAKDGNLLFVCDGSDQVKLLDATHPDDLQLLARIKSKGPFDVMAANNILMVVAAGGFYQYNYSNLENISLLSFFPVK
jgi:hypothetical protein